MKLLESFQAGADFDEKNRWQLAKPHIKCSVCKLTVQEIVKLLPDSENLVDNRVLLTKLSFFLNFLFLDFH